MALVSQLIKLRQELLNTTNSKIMVNPKKRSAFIIPKPDSGEEESKYIQRCMDAIGSEYDTEDQAIAVCYAQLGK